SLRGHVEAEREAEDHDLVERCGEGVDDEGEDGPDHETGDHQALRLRPIALVIVQRLFPPRFDSSGGKLDRPRSCCRHRLSGRPDSPNSTRAFFPIRKRFASDLSKDQPKSRPSTYDVTSAGRWAR